MESRAWTDGRRTGEARSSHDAIYQSESLSLSAAVNRIDTDDECALGWPVGKTGKTRFFWRVPLIAYHDEAPRRTAER